MPYSAGKMLEQMLGSAAGSLQTLQAFSDKPDLADDTFLLAGRALHYCPASIATSSILPLLLESATQGLLVQHRSVLKCHRRPLCLHRIQWKSLLHLSALLQEAAWVVTAALIDLLAASEVHGD